MIPSAVAALERRLGTASRVLELGAGSSTSWLAERVAEVVSYEADAAWAAGVDAALAREGHRNVTILQVPVDDTPAALRESAGEAFDVVIVDCYETPRVTRLDCLVAAAPLVGRRGCLVLDDSDRVQLRDAPAHLPGWRVERHVGMKQFPLMATETSLFWRPGDADPD
jgi:predicted O-methyltransferase YrrM